MDGESELEEDADPHQFTTLFTEQAAEFIESAGENPFSLVLSTVIPHRPLMPMEEFAGGSRQGIYGDAVQELDWSIGALMEVLRQLEKYEDTLVIFVSDNGPATQSEEALGYVGGTSRPFRGGKGQTLEGGMRVPCVARLPGRIPEGLLCHDIVTAMDLLPTFAKLAGATFEKRPEIDGIDIWPNMVGEKIEAPLRNTFYYYRENVLQAVRQDEWKLNTYRKSWGLEKPEKSDYMLYNLESDPAEESNVADQHPEKVDELAKVADRARRELGDSIHGRRGRSTRKAGEVAMA